jgi:hypothetical protein
MKSELGSFDHGLRRTTRRTVVATLLSMPVVARFARRAAPSRDAASRRPVSIGGSGTRCGVCGSDGHSMLSCPESPRVV